MPETKAFIGSPERSVGRCQYGCNGKGAAFSRLAPRGGKLVLGRLDPLLELPAVGFRLAALDAFELRLRLLELLLGGRRIDLADVDRRVDKRESAVLLDREEAGTGGELLHFLRLPVRVHAGRAGLEEGNQRGVPREHADLSGCARNDNHLGLVVEDRPIGRRQRERERVAFVCHLESYAGTASVSSASLDSSSASASCTSAACSGSPPCSRPFATASSIVPTM